MKPPKFILSLAVAICPLAVANLQAQSAVTNLVLFSAVTYTQGSTNDNGTNTTYGPIAKAPHATSGQNGILGELGQVLTPPISTAAKLVLIAPQNGSPKFAVLDGANLYDLSESGSNIMILNPSDNNKIRAGTQSDTTPQRNTTDMQLMTVSYSDTNWVHGNLQFTLTGVAAVVQTDTAPVNGIYTETIKAKVADMTGEGFSGSGPFVATGSLTIVGKGNLTVPVP